MIGNALVIGFFTAIGWFSAQKLMIAIDHKAPTKIEEKNKE
jgi:TRAP-type C4-dicarboxylate transport system permease small subunit